MRTDQEKNSIKENLSLAFMHSLNSTANYHLQQCDRQFDNLGIDLQIINYSHGKVRSGLSEGNQINIQIKGVSETSTSMFSETEEAIRYNLKKQLNAVGTHYLIIVVMPSDDDIETWREMDEQSITLWARAYYYLVNDSVKAGRITIPKSNMLNSTTYAKLFDAARNRDAL